MTRGSAQAGDRASKTGRYLQWWEHESEWHAVISAVDNWCNSTHFFGGRGGLVGMGKFCFDLGCTAGLASRQSPCRVTRSASGGVTGGRWEARARYL